MLTLSAQSLCAARPRLALRRAAGGGPQCGARCGSCSLRAPAAAPLLKSLASQRPAQRASVAAACSAAAVWTSPAGSARSESALALALAATLQAFARLAALARAASALVPAAARRPALSLAAAPLALAGLSLSELLGNPTFCATGLAWVLAQTLKIFTKYLNTRAWDVRVLFDSGGMPSSHTSLVVGLATSVAVQHGLGSSLFVMCLAFALIVMYDAAGVRRHAGKQAEVLNALVEDYFQGHPVSEQELKEVLGHTPLQVAMGALLGVVTALAYHVKCV